MSKIQLVHTYDDIIYIENLYLAWEEFIVGKKRKSDVQMFARNLMDNIIELHESLVNKSVVSARRLRKFLYQRS